MLLYAHCQHHIVLNELWNDGRQFQRAIVAFGAKIAFTIFETK